MSRRACPGGVMLQLCRRLNGHSLPESQDMRLAAGRRCCALLAARRPSWRCGGGTQRAWRPWQPPATYRGLATATWTTSCCTPRPARWCPSTSGARGGDALHSALLILLRLLGSHTGDIPCAEEFALHHMPACRGAGCAAGGAQLSCTLGAAVHFLSDRRRAVAGTPSAPAHRRCPSRSWFPSG